MAKDILFMCEGKTELMFYRKILDFLKEKRLILAQHKVGFVNVKGGDRFHKVPDLLPPELKKKKV